VNILDSTNTSEHALMTRLWKKIISSAASGVEEVRLWIMVGLHREPNSLVR